MNPRILLGRPSYIDARGTLEARFPEGIAVCIWGGHGRRDLYFVGTPRDLRHEGRSDGPTTRRLRQLIALEGFFGPERRFRLTYDEDGTARAELLPIEASGTGGAVGGQVKRA